MPSASWSWKSRRCFPAGCGSSLPADCCTSFMRLRGEPVPSAIQWRSIAVASLCMFVATYAALFWAEQYVASGMTSVIEATLPIITVMLEVFVFRQQQFRWSAPTAVALGSAVSRYCCTAAATGPGRLALHGDSRSRRGLVSRCRADPHPAAPPVCGPDGRRTDVARGRGPAGASASPASCILASLLAARSVGASIPDCRRLADCLHRLSSGCWHACRRPGSPATPMSIRWSPLHSAISWPGSHSPHGCCSPPCWSWRASSCCSREHPWQGRRFLHRPGGQRNGNTERVARRDPPGAAG